MSSSNDKSIQAILDAVSTLTTKIDNIHTEQVAIRVTLNNDVSALSDSINNKFTTLQVQNEVTKTRVDTCESSINQMRYEIELLKQRQLNSNICIDGIPYNPNENLKQIFEKVCKVINYNLPAYNAIYRTHGTTKKSIIVSIQNESNKFGILGAKKIKKSVITEELQLNLTTNTEVRINHHLSPYFANLLYTARQSVKQGELHAAWYTTKGINIIKSSNDTPQIVTSTNDLMKAIYQPKTNSYKRKASDELPQQQPKKPINTTTTDELSQASQNTTANTTTQEVHHLINTRSNNLINTTTNSTAALPSALQKPEQHRQANRAAPQILSSTTITKSPINIPTGIQTQNKITKKKK